MSRHSELRFPATILAPLVLLLALTACRATPSPAGPVDAAARATTEAGHASRGEIAAAASSGGATTVLDGGRSAFGHAARNLSPELRRQFAVGNAFFNDNWVAAPASTVGRDGLGPTFNAQACSSCHFKDGRAQPPDEDEPLRPGLLLRLSLPGEGEHGEPVALEGYGVQIQDRAIGGVPAEGRLVVDRQERPGAYSDGTAYTLLAPTYRVEEPAFGALPPETLTSPRIAPAVIGLGLLEALPEADIVALADPDDADGDGISGRPNRVWDEAAGATVLGRFGWKANQPSVRQQAAGAFLGDIGISSSLFPDQDCPAPQAACRASPTGGEPELEDLKLDRVELYNRTLGVPARRDLDDPRVLAGEVAFTELGCAGCHLTALRTGADHPLEAVRGQTIHPYTDLLLHDMGPDLADGRPDFLASGSEWRTPPLWGIGLVDEVNGHTRLLHDGRARDLAEAILWHGGEAEKAREGFRTLPKAEREAILAFLESL